MASEDFLNGFVLGYSLALGEARQIRQDVDRALDAAAAKTQARLDDFAQRHGLDVAAPLARPPRVTM